MTGSPTTYDQGPQSVDLLRRLRAWNVSSWRHGDRLRLTRLALGRLAVLAARADGIPRPEVPEVGSHALADQLQVLIDDAREAGAGRDEVTAILADLAARLGLPHR